MASQEKTIKFGTSILVTIGATNLSPNAGATSQLIDNYDANGLGYDRGILFVKIKAGANAPAVGYPINFYIVNAYDDGTILDGGVAESTVYTSTSTPLTALQIAEQMRAIGAQPCIATAWSSYQCSIPLDGLGPQFAFYVTNECGATLSPTAGDFSFKLYPITDYFSES